MRKTILVLTNFDVGLYKFRKELLQTLMEQGHEVFISLPKGDLVEKLTDMGCHYIETTVDRRGLNPVKDIRLLFQYRALIQKLKPNLVITYTIKPNIYGGIACRMANIPYAVNITGLGTSFQKEGFLKKLVVFLYRSGCKKARRVFFENQENKSIFLKEKVISEHQACCLNGAGVSLSEYSFTPYPPDEGAVRFLFIGRVMKEKGIEELFEAMERLKEVFPHVHLDVVGMYEENYQNRIEELVKKKVIDFHGYREEVRPFIERCHCFVLPSYHEGMANTLLEAGAVGRPLITSDISGCREAVEEGGNGFLAEKGNAKKLYEVMYRFVQLDWNEKQQLGIASRKKMEQEFDKVNVVAETIKGLE